MILFCTYLFNPHLRCSVQDPSRWDDVLTSGRIRGSCKASGCDGDKAVGETTVCLSCSILNIFNSFENHARIVK